MRERLSRIVYYFVSAAAARLRRIGISIAGLRSVAACRSGSVMPIVAISALTLIGVTGFAIDGGRLLLLHSKLQTAVDAAGLSSAAKMTTSAVDDEIEKFLKVNFAKAYIDATITSHSSSLSNDDQTLTVRASAEAPTVFMRLFGIDRMTTDAFSEITRATGGLELALVLDVTGSMRTNDKIGSLKVAAKDLIQIIFGDDATSENLHVGIVPFTQTVNVGTERKGWLTGSVPNKWSGCIEMRHGGLLDVTDAPISSGRFPALSSGTCPPVITPMTSSKSKLIKAINGLEANGNTNVNVGAVWGWRLLSPRWKGDWGGDMGANLPLAYDDKFSNKAAVIMTDGQNEISDGSAYGDAECIRVFIVFCLEYAYDDRLGAIGSRSKLSDLRAAANTELDKRLSSVCTAMKNQDITVYTIALGNPGKDIEELMRKCASQDAYFFNTPTGAELRTAFSKIGGSLSNLRVSR